MMHSKVPQDDAQEDRLLLGAPAARQAVDTTHCMTGTEVNGSQSAMQAFVIQRHVSTLKGSAYAGMRPGQSRQWQKYSS